MTTSILRSPIIGPAKVEYSFRCALDRPRSQFEGEKLERKREKKKIYEIRVILLIQLFRANIIAARPYLQKKRPPPAPSKQEPEPAKCSCKPGYNLGSVHCTMHRWKLGIEANKPNSMLTDQEKKTVKKELQDHVIKTNNEYDRRRSKRYYMYEPPGISRFGKEALLSAKQLADPSNSCPK